MKKTHTGLRMAALVLATALLSGCMSSTPYAPKERPSGPGYSDLRISENRYRVTFTGNSVTSRDTVENFLLLRAAEVTIESQYECFSFAGRDTTENVQYYATFNDFGWYPRWRGHAWYWHNWYGDPWGPNYNIHQVRRYEAYAEIIMHACRGDDQELKASDVIDHLGPQAVPPPKD